MINKIIVSIIIPVYNCKAYLEATIESVLAQTLTEFELILIDDGSTDGSEKIVEQYMEKDKRIKAIHIQNQGPSVARNIGLLEAQGEWIQFLDADDLFEPDMLMGFYEKTKGAEVVVGGAVQEFVRSNKQIELSMASIQLKNKQDIADYLKNMDEHKKALMLNYVWNRWIKKSVLNTNKIKFDESLHLGEDFVFNCQVIKNVSTVNIVHKAYYHHYYRNNTTLSNCFVADEAERRRRMHDELCQLMRSYNIYDEVIALLEENEGKYCWIGLTKVCLPDCNLSKKEKIEYVKRLATKTNRKYMYKYFKAQGGILNKLRCGVIKCNTPSLMYAFLRGYDTITKLKKKTT